MLKGQLHTHMRKGRLRRTRPEAQRRSDSKMLMGIQLTSSQLLPTFFGSLPFAPLPGGGSLLAIFARQGLS